MSQMSKQGGFDFLNKKNQYSSVANAPRSKQFLYNHHFPDSRRVSGGVGLYSSKEGPKWSNSGNNKMKANDTGRKGSG
jgi:hypothetical protein